ncbi:MAG: hypothetical protein Q9169_006098 [Polycauliona sp. 2 TL-2023]
MALTDFVGVKALPVYSMVKEAVVYANALSFFGQDLAHDQVFLKSATDFIESTLLFAEIIRLVPTAIAPYVGKILTSRYTTDRTIHDILVPIAEERLEEAAQKRLGHKVDAHKDCIQWVIESSPRSKPWTAERVVHELMALWFGSVHVLTTTICFAIHDLCLHPEYVEPLRKELAGPLRDEFERTGKGLPLLDSFIRESARTTPVESMSTRRQALEPFALSGGWKVEVGDMVCTPARAMMKDPAHFTAPQEFSGFRFVEPQLLADLNSPQSQTPQPGQAHQLTDATDWQVWGTGRMVW